MTIFNVKTFFSKLRTAPWVVIILIVALIAAFFPIWPDGAGGKTDMIGWVITWFGGLFKAASAGIVGWWFCRHVMKCNLSDLPDELKGLAGVACAIVIAAFVIGVTHSI